LGCFFYSATQIAVVVYVPDKVRPDGFIVLVLAGETQLPEEMVALLAV